MVVRATVSDQGSSLRMATTALEETIRLCLGNQRRFSSRTEPTSLIFTKHQIPVEDRNTILLDSYWPHCLA